MNTTLPDLRLPLEIRSNSGYRRLLISRSERNNRDLYSILLENDFSVLSEQNSHTMARLDMVSIKVQALQEFMLSVRDLSGHFESQEFVANAILRSNYLNLELVVSRDQNTDGKSRGLAELSVHIATSDGFLARMNMLVDEASLLYSAATTEDQRPV